ncbi:MAG: YihY/virulence factor BrkB family protein [Rhodothermales bacterium]|nr:YihY/virulence factor BrkB family protein [Rhodothermales bacterium]
MQFTGVGIAERLKGYGRFLWSVLKGFRANQGILLSGAVAFYTLLSIIPLFALVLVGLSQVLEEETLLSIVTENISLVVPDLTETVMRQVRQIYAYRPYFGWIGFGTLLFFSSLAFTVLENALSVIFFHRVSIKRRHFLVSAIMPYAFIVLVGVGILVITLTTGFMEAIEGQRLAFLGLTWRPSDLGGTLLHVMGVVGHIVLLTSIYLVLPVGKISVRHALIGGIVAGLLWELVRQVLLWYFSTLSVVNIVYGSFAATIVALLSLEAGAIVILLGAQVIAEYERLHGGLPEPETPGSEGDLETA